jgi:hypothetical protein
VVKPLRQLGASPRLRDRLVGHRHSPTPPGPGLQTTGAPVSAVHRRSCASAPV